jgi:rSAM/selenodomain-associated transferase 1
MVMAADHFGPVATAILARAPIPGFAKTRLIPALGQQGAACLQARLTERAVATACAAAIGPVTLWVTPDESHATFEALCARGGATLARQCDGDLGARMLAAIAAVNGPVLVIGTDCPALTTDHLQTAAAALHAGNDVVVFPAEDGGYVLIGMHRPLADLFADMRWSTGSVIDETRRRFKQLGLVWQEPATLWDVDVPDDLARLQASGLENLLPVQSEDQAEFR